MASFSCIKSKIFDREERKQQYQAHIRGLNAYDRHKKFLNDYVAFYGRDNSSSQLKLPVKTDQDTIREGYRFIRTEEDDKDTSWEQRLVKRYYDKLFKEYCIADMSHYKIGKIGLRWRTEKEVISGKGQFVCGNKHCDEKYGLASYEVNFSYVEAGENKQALVKLVTCERCAEKLHYKRQKEKELLEGREKEDYRRKRDLSISDHDTDDEEYEDSKERRKSSKRRDKEEHKRKRERSGSDDTDEEHERRRGAERTEKEEHKKKRERSRSDDTDEEQKRRKGSEGREKEEQKRNRDKNEVHVGSKEKGKGKEASSNHADNDDDFDEFLEGMFP